MNKKRVAMVIAVIFVAIMVLLGVAKATGEQRELSAVEKTLRIVATPVEKGIAWASDKVGGFFGTFLNYEELQAENERLKEELTQMSAKYNEQKEAVAENIRLRKMLEFKEANEGTLTLSAAKVIAENNTNLQHTIVLDKGSNDGIQNDMTVINYQGLIGRVINVLPGSCEVILITDRQGTVGARVYETRETTGMVEGRGSNTMYLKMIHMAHDADIVPGDHVVTSGLDGIFTAGIPIGKVIEVTDEANGLMKEATIETYVNFYRLEEVFIVTSTEGSGQW